jgi:hypothetical protein
MLTGLEILLARMKTNPEEFHSKDGVAYDGEMFGGKWSDLLDYAWRIADNDEREMITKARDEFYRDDFNERVFKRLAGEEKQGEKGKTMKVKMGERYSVGQSDPRVMAGTFNPNTQMIGSQTFEECEQQAAKLRMQLQAQAMREEMAQRQYDAMRQSVNPLGVSVGKRGFFGKFGW